MGKVSHCSLHLCFSDDVHFHIPVFHLYVFFGKMSFQVVCPLFDLFIGFCFVYFCCCLVGWVFLAMSFIRPLYILDINLLIGICLQIAE